MALTAAPPPPVIHPADRLSRLPDEVLARILSSLPAREAVRTCVLARAWRDLWKSTRRLRITGGRGTTVQEARGFVDGLLRSRLDALSRASLDECELVLRMHDDYDGRDAVSRWIHSSLKCQVRRLRVVNEDDEEEHGLVDYFLMSDRPLVSRCLRRLELSGLWFEHIDLNLDGCPALERLEIRFCSFLGVRRIVSPSLRRLVIAECESGEDRLRFGISAPCLVSLWLEVGKFRAPRLESMPELVEAHVRIDSYWDGSCYCNDPVGCYHAAGHISDSDVDSDNEEDYPEDGCVLLEGLAQAKDLVLLSHHSMYILRRDLRMCPTFSNLKALVLNGYWCEPADCRALACILEHTPVLEKLTVLFSGKVELEYEIVLEGCPDATAKSTMTTQCLKTVKVKCNTVHEGVQNVLKFLCTLNICFNLGVTEGSA